MKFEELVDVFYKYAVDQDTFKKMISKNDKKQWAIISTETANERLWDNTNAYKKDESTFTPVPTSNYKNERKTKWLQEQYKKLYNVEPLQSKWIDPETNKENIEKSFLFYNINYDKAFSIAWNAKQDAFIFKPWNGPVQLINCVPSTIQVSKKYAYSSADNLFSKSLKDNSSFLFSFFTEDAIDLPFKETPYKWNDPEIIKIFGNREMELYQ